MDTSVLPAAPDAAPADEVVLTARDVVKTYGSTHALKRVNFDIRRGKVTTLFGENGAGKSTLMKILSGVVTPTSGAITLDGKPVSFSSTTEARDHGISIIHQELSLAPNLSVRDNIFLGREIRTGRGVDFAEEARQTRKLMEELEEDIDPSTPVEELRLGQQQIVEIARALSVDARILIMDEPTSALSAAEVEVLFKVIRDLTARGVSIVYISHHLEEALEITDYAVVLRDGAITATAEARDIDLQWIVRNMVGEHYDRGSPPGGYAFGPVRLSARNVCVADTAGSGALLVDHLSLDVRAGEIVCIYGLMGAGRTELLEAIAGRVPMQDGEVLLEGRSVAGLSIAQRIDRGLVLVPEDRQRDGLVQTMSVGQNLSLANIGAFTRRLLTSAGRERELVGESIRNVHIKTAGGGAPIGSLSGGNQQKVVIGKMLATHPKVILLDEPSRGIDIGAKAEVFRLLAEKAAEGLAVVFSTSEVQECHGVAHRIVVMSRGRIAAEFAHDAAKEDIMAASGEAVVA
ncbi:MAG: sugar ABC transporter ATP-binding protein [Gluconacetobacter diazotrophicus]|nr:sugar ABC transporter ATP-binding protein [Gluconacetobacter diazotrophicus]